MSQSQFNHLNELNKYQTLYELERECTIYNFFRKKHYKEIPGSVIRNRLKKLLLFDSKKYIKEKEKEKDIYIVKPLVWIRRDDPRLHGLMEFFGRIKSEIFDFILIDERYIPFYLLKKYGSKVRLELEIFSELKKLKKEVMRHTQEQVKIERKKLTKERKKQYGTRKSR